LASAICSMVLHFSNSGQRWRAKFAVFLIILFVIAVPQNSDAYSVLTHEALIDAAWENEIQPLLVKRFPGATAEDLTNAHAYAYGGSIIQDLGYFPFGSKFFTNLVHYVRSGDFVEALLRDSRDLDEYAFAIGALSHFSADNDGHRLAVNRIVPMLYPELREKYGPIVVYDENPAAHLKTEFALDVIQVAKRNYAPNSYHEYIGFQVSKGLLERAFRDT
jgi:zinc dependent phospholipase C